MWLPNLAATTSSFQTTGTTITAHADAHTKGSWVELVASAPFDVTMIGIGASVTVHGSGTDTSQLTDIGVGASTAEKVLIANIPSGYNALYVPNSLTAWFPIHVPSGTRISARMQATITVDVVDIQLFMFGASSWMSVPAFQTIDTIGALTASSHGTLLSDSIVEIIASTAEDYKALGFGVDGGGTTSMGNDRFLELFVGAGAAEKSLINNFKIYTSNAEAVDSSEIPSGIIPIEMNIPSGSRLSAQLSGSLNLGLVLFGFR